MLKKSKVEKFSKINSTLDFKVKLEKKSKPNFNLGLETPTLNLKVLVWTSNRVFFNPGL